MLRSTLCLGVASLALAATAIAEEAETQIADLNLQTVTVTSLRPKDRSDVTASVTTIDAADLAVRNSPFVIDQLRAVPGVAVSRNGSAGGLNQLRLRGSEANHTLVLLDGIEVSDPVNGETDFGLFSGAGAGAIEIARGEQSALYGSDAIGGVVNILTSPQDGFQGLIEGGSRSTHRIDAGYGWQLDQGSITASIHDTASDGVDTSGLSGEEDGFRNSSGLLRGDFALGQDWSVDGLLRYSDSQVDFDSDTDIDGLLNDVDRVTEAQQLTLGGAVQGDAFGLSHIFRASYTDVTRDNFADGDLTDTAEGERTKFAYSPSISLSTGGGDVTVSGLFDHETEDYSVSDVAFAGATTQDQSFETLGVAGETAASFDAVSLNASLRYDDNDSRFDDVTTWRVGGAYRFDFGGKLRASAGTGVKNPTFTELFGFFPGTFEGNPDLQPEKSTSWEIGWDQSYGAVNWSVTYFSAELEDEIFTSFFVADAGDPNDPFDDIFFSRPENRDGDSERSGVEFAANWRASQTLTFGGALSNITSEDDSGEDEIRVPEWTGSLAIDWASEAKPGLRAGLALDYVGEQLDTNFGTFETVTLDAYSLVSTTVEYPLTERISLSLRGDNLLDEDAVDVFGYNGPGAGVFAGIRIR